MSQCILVRLKTLIIHALDKEIVKERVVRYDCIINGDIQSIAQAISSQK